MFVPLHDDDGNDNEIMRMLQSDTLGLKLLEFGHKMNLVMIPVLALGVLAIFIMSLILVFVKYDEGLLKSIFIVSAVLLLIIVFRIMYDLKTKKVNKDEEIAFMKKVMEEQRDRKEKE